MHLTLKREAAKPAARNVLQQQACFDPFMAQYDTERQHTALAMKCQPTSMRRRPAVPRADALGIPASRLDGDGDDVRPDLLLGPEGDVRQVVAGQAVGVRQVSDGSGS